MKKRQWNNKITQSEIETSFATSCHALSFVSLHFKDYIVKHNIPHASLHTDQQFIIHSVVAYITHFIRYKEIADVIDRRFPTGIGCSLMPQKSRRNAFLRQARTAAQRPAPRVMCRPILPAILTTSITTVPRGAVRQRALTGYDE